ncbi:protein NUCLEAR FUSION DEFECTIVE 4-like isoform X2 [Cynara cardunculus var. scolymus]|uniref:protein NUCLEAR FUSION DEFECTIVE 4-like isoform X2 n=1 Tax=Cynara cardunculus var. scolymus TaxID=59895 RepID=UPI000D62755B|nr:protein NUCLEAR FUSION DEFECTIVE 4-like isoform X2 [Cynara cardunculus var. scolymus]
MLGVANDIGENVGILPGIFYNKFPTWVVLFIGALCCFSGYGVIWLALTHTIDSLPYWLLWIALCVATNSNAWFTTAVLATNMRNFPLSRGVGSGVTVLNNLAQIGIAQGVHNTAILLCLFGFCNFVGRLSGGAISEHFARSRSIPRTVWMTCTQVLMIVTYLMFASAIRGTLYATTSLLGICYGVQFSIMIPTTSELFGLKNFSIFYNVISLGNPLGAFLFSGLLAGNIYDYEVSKQNSVSCLGPNCFRLTFFVLAGLCSVGTILSIILTRRLKPVYELLYGSGSFRLRSPNH